MNQKPFTHQTGALACTVTAGSYIEIENLMNFTNFYCFQRLRRQNYTYLVAIWMNYLSRPIIYALGLALALLSIRIALTLFPLGGGHGVSLQIQIISFQIWIELHG